MAISDFPNLEFLIPKISKKTKFLEKPIKNIFLIKKNGIYVLKTGICYAHAKFWGSPSIFGPQIAPPKKRKNHTYQNFGLQFLDVLDHLQK